MNERAAATLQAPSQSSGNERSERWLLRGTGLFRAWMALSIPIATPFLLPRVQKPLLLIVVEIAWLASSGVLFARSFRAGSLTVGAAWTDVAATSLIMIVSGAVGFPRWTELGNLVSGWANASALSAAATSRRPRQSVLPSVVLAASFVVSRAIGASGGLNAAVDAFTSDGFTILALGFAGAVVARLLRRWGRRLDEATARTREQAAALATAHTRMRQARDLHDHLLQVLELIATGRAEADVETRRSADAESARIRSELRASRLPSGAAPLGEPEEGIRSAERSLASCAAVYRIAVVPFAAVLLPLSLGSFTHPALVAIIDVIVLAESAWLIRYLLKGRSHRDARIAALDVAACGLLATGVVAFARPAEIGDAGPLLAPLVMGALLGAGIAATDQRTIVRLTAFASAVYLGAVAVHSGGSANAILTALVDEVMWFVGWAAGGRVLAVELRDAGRALDRERAAEAVHAARLAEERERDSFMRNLGNDSLSILDVFARTSGDGDEGLRAAAARSGEWLRVYLRDDTRQGLPRSLRAALTHVALEARDHGVRVQVHTASLAGDTDDFEPEIVDAIAGAVREALRNVAKHAGTELATVRASLDDDRLTVTVVDTGRGFVDNRHGFGITSSIQGRVRDAGGNVTIEGAPSEGVRVEISFELHPGDSWDSARTVMEGDRS